MARSDKEARRKARLADRDAERARRREAFETRNSQAGLLERRREAHDERQARIRADRVRRQEEFQHRNEEAAAKEPVREPRTFTNKTMPAPENKELPPGENKEGKPSDPAVELVGVTFASPQARARAKELAMTAEHFKKRKRTSAGGFTVDDVERIATTLGIEDEDEGDKPAADDAG